MPNEHPVTKAVTPLLLFFFRGRLNHGRHFTFHSSMSDMAITFLTPNVTGSITDNDHKFAACGTWLQVCSGYLSEM